jgi:hypothetical protein
VAATTESVRRSSRAYEGTDVPVTRSLAGLEDLLERRGVTDRRVTRTASLLAIDFNWPLMDERRKVRALLGVRMVVPWPADERERRRMARLIFWHLKSKLEAVEAGLLTFEEEFLPHLTLGRAGPRVWDDAKPAIEAAIREGKDLSHDLMGGALRALGTGAR